MCHRSDDELLYGSDGGTGRRRYVQGCLCLCVAVLAAIAVTVVLLVPGIRGGGGEVAPATGTAGGGKDGYDWDKPGDWELPSEGDYDWDSPGFDHDLPEGEKGAGKHPSQEGADDDTRSPPPARNGTSYPSDDETGGGAPGGRFPPALDGKS
eukprot:CAMPEP_0197438774 /NCGR_PEP_ID=MMETSP1175-20131217/5677_1 /TAXON_ID=1003142 /ORGANISM="Triceratium dubium, Strain CCMP147" /LENGTH=151 /DNA_ID=CAMNT_0042968571 /DNA_START=11 /DNA_END=462 /DNA_ORIENTATION=+